jgi:hypothetical protein
MVILDEIHHAGDSRTWGDGVKSAFEPAVRRLMLTGTPFRSDENPIPFVTYERGGRAAAVPLGLVYGYADALRDGVVRPVLFLAYSGETRWRTSAGDELAARLGEPMTKDLVAQAWRTALDPAATGCRRCCRRPTRGCRLRGTGMPTPAAWSSRATSRPPARTRAASAGFRGAAVVVLSDDAGASRGSPRTRRPSSAGWSRSDGRRRAWTSPPGRRRVRDERLHPALLRAGDRPLRPRPPAR